MQHEEPLFLIDGAQKIDVMAERLVRFISAAKVSVHVAIYDFRLKDPTTAERVVHALNERADKGIEVRIAYDHRNAPKFAVGTGEDPAPHGTHAFLGEHFAHSAVKVKPIGWTEDVALKPIAGSKLMHSKYVLRDGHTEHGAVLMGSANFTDDAWTRQDNNVMVLHSPALCAFYETDFSELWASGNIAGTGVNDFGPLNRDGLHGEIAFSPGEGKFIDDEITKLIDSAERSIHIASMVITSDKILAALERVMEAGRVPLHGIFDGPEMHSAESQMTSATKRATIDRLRKVLAGKRSTPYSDNGVHDFMHNKLVVVDDTVLTGSHNFSLSAQHNAENTILLRDPTLAAKYRDYVSTLVKKYGQ